MQPTDKPAALKLGPSLEDPYVFFFLIFFKLLSSPCIFLIANAALYHTS